MDEAVHAPWWQDSGDGAALERVVRDLLAAELALARPGRVLPPQPWPDTADLALDLGADSLDLMAAASALGDFFGFAAGDDGETLLASHRLEDWIAATRSSLARQDTRLTFRTSGSSGAPKRCAHDLRALWREVDELARILPGRRRILGAVPAHHIYGFLFTVLLPQAAAGPDAPLPFLDLRASAPGLLAGRVGAGDLVVAHPDYWDAVAALAPRFPPDVTGVSSTAPLRDTTARALAGCGLRLVQVYGSSETAGVGWRDSPDQPYRLFPYWRRGAQEGTIAREDVAGAQVFRLQDRLAWQGTDLFVPGGRVDAAVQVAGTNVFPGYVAEVLAMHPDVAECAVRPMRPDEGSRLKAFVVARSPDDAQVLRARLDAWLTERLRPAERPAAFSFGPALPRQPNGKLADWIIDAWE